MDPGQSEHYEFLDLTDIDESERFHLNNTLFPSEQSSHDLSDSGVWNEGTFESDRLSTLNSGSSVPPSESDFSMNGDHQAISPQFGVGTPCPPGNAAMYTAGPQYNMQQQAASPSHMYHLMQPPPLNNVYVGNVTANVNVHGYMGHYVPFIHQAPVEQNPEVSTQRPVHTREWNPRGRRGRGGHNKHDYQQSRSQQMQPQHIQQEMVDVQQQPNTYQYMPVPYQPAYYPTGPQSHLAQHATGSPLYVGQHMPMYAPMPHLYQFHPGMVYSPVGMPEYQMMDPTTKMENCEMEMYPQVSEVAQHMVGMNIQGEEIYNCVPTIVSHQEVTDYSIMGQNNSEELVECPENQAKFMVNEATEKIIEEHLPLEPLTNITENIAISFENSAQPQKEQDLNTEIQPLAVNTTISNVPTEVAIVSTPHVNNTPSNPIETATVQEPVVQSTVPVQQPSAPKSKGPFVNNKDIVKTGLGRKTRPSINHNRLAHQIHGENKNATSAPQPQEIQKLQLDKSNDRPKSQTPPNSVWVDNQLYTPPPSSDVDIVPVQKIQSNIDSVVSNINNSKSSNIEKRENEISKSSEATPPVHEQLPIETSAVVTPSQSKSWASLFNNKADILSTGSVGSSISINSVDTSINSMIKPVAVVQPLENSNMNSIAFSPNTNQSKGNATPSSTFLDPNSYRAGEFLAKYNLDNKTISLQPRGLTNRSNYCYINSTLQALIACPPLYNLLKALPHQVPKKGKSSTPVIDAMVQLAYEFAPLPAGARVGRREKGQQRKDELPDVSAGPAFEPLVIHRMLNGFHPNTFQVEGRQEDAEEFLSCLLNGLNDEMVELIKLVEPEEKSPVVTNGDIVNGHQCDDDDWKVMGPKNKGSITRRSYFGRSPISDIFRGQLRSRVQRAGDLTTDSVQPFFTLQLDIEKAASVSQALELLVGRDQLEGVTCSKTNQEIEAWQQVSLEELPVVLILHLKWFDYKLDGCTKIVKNVEFPIDLKIDSKIMSSKIKYTPKQRQYKLFAVVYHDGKEASKGHYVTDVFHVGFNGWIRYDDSVVKAVTENMVLHPRQPRVPYLLYYRRCDTIGPSNNNNSTNNGNQRTH